VRAVAGFHGAKRMIIQQNVETINASVRRQPAFDHAAGFRSFYVTKRHSDGATDTVIAGEIGDKTVALRQTTCGERPKNWIGGEPIRWLPAHGKPSWQSWQNKFCETGYGNQFKKESKRKSSMFQCRRCGEMADAQDLKSWDLKTSCGFESHHRHQLSVLRGAAF
jgi:hypothetical protein